MEEGLFKPIDLKEFLKNSPFLSPLKENYPDYLKQLIERTLEYWDIDEIEKAKEQIRIFNSNFEGFQIGTLIEMGIDFKDLDVENTISYLNEISEESLSSLHTKFAFHILRAVLYFSLWDIDLARKDCDDAIKADPTSKITYYLRGTCFALRGLHYSAITDYKNALKDNYKKDEITACLAYSYLKTQNIRKSFRLHKRIVDKFPENDKIQYYTGLCFKSFKKYSKAIKYFSKAIELKPDNASYKLTRGRVLMQLKRYHEAESDLSDALKLGKAIASELLKINSEVLGEKITSKRANKKVLELLRKNSS